MNDLISFRRSCRSFSGGNISRAVSLSAGYRAPHGNDCFDTNTTDGLKELLNGIDSEIIEDMSEDLVLIQLPFDQPPGLLLRLLRNQDVSSDMRRLLKVPIHKGNAPMRVAIHIRRGDVTRQSFPDWWIPGDYYCRLLDALDNTLPKDWSITIVSQEPFDNEIREMVSAINARNNYNLLEVDVSKRVSLEIAGGQWSNHEEVPALQTMMLADVIIGTISSFACLASKLAGNDYILVTTNGREVNSGLPYDIQSIYSSLSHDNNCQEIAELIATRGQIRENR